MASEIGKIVHCKICGTPIVAKGNRLFCPVCYNQNRRNAAQRSNARTKVQREQMKREEEKMKQNNCAVTSAAGLNMRAKLADMGGMSYGELSMWEKTHGLEFAAWEHEWEKLNSGTASDGLKFPDHLPEGFPTRKAPPAHSWSAAAERAPREAQCITLVMSARTITAINSSKRIPAHLENSICARIADALCCARRCK